MDGKSIFVAGFAFSPRLLSVIVDDEERSPAEAGLPDVPRADPSVTNPSRRGDGLGYATTYTYDALNRTSQVTAQDGTVTCLSYSGNQTTVKDPAGHQRETFTDGLGRLTAVVEDPGGLNYTTVYGYDALDDLTCVNHSTASTGTACNSSQAGGRSFTYDSLKRLTKAVNPESGTTSYGYDAVGNLVAKTDGRGVVACFGNLSGTNCDGSGYDAVNRPTMKSYSDGQTATVSYGYDASGVAFSIGRLTQVNNGSSIQSYTAYDPFGNVKASSQTTAGQSYAFSYGYNLAGALTSETYPSGRVVSTAYDGANRPNSVSGIANGQTTNYALNAQYAPHGGLISFGTGNQVVPWFQYSPRLQITVAQAAVNGSTSSYLFVEQPSWGIANNNGDLQSVAVGTGAAVSWNNLTAFTTTFGYDNVDRLTSGSDTGGWSRNYCYDVAGNGWVTNWSGTVPLAGNTPQEIGGSCPSSTTPYNTSTNRLSAGSYNAAGNQLVVNGDTATYDAESRQIATLDTATSNTESYAYNGDGKRVRKSGPDGLTVYVYDALGRLAGEYSTTQNTSLCATCYLTYDHLGSVRMVTDSGAKVISRHDYSPFGEEIPTGDAGRGSPWGLADNVSQRFTGKERDQETGVDYFGARYYGSALGRFTSADPMGMLAANPDNPQSWNQYSYVWNNPLANIDPSGMSCVALDDGSQADDGDGSGCKGAGVKAGNPDDASTLNQGQVNAQATAQNPSDLEYWWTISTNAIPLYDRNDVPLNDYARNLIVRVNQQLPVICGGGADFYAGRVAAVGVGEALAGSITEVDSRNGVTTGALFEGSAGEGLSVGGGAIVSKGAGGGAAVTPIVFGGSAVHAVAAGASAGAVGFQSGAGVYAEADLLVNGVGAGVYVNISAGACPSGKH